MDLHWVPPPQGTTKVNVHGAAFDHSVSNGNISGVWVVMRTSSGNLLNCITDTIPNLTAFAVQLLVILIGLRRAYIEGALSVIIETDKLEPFGAIQHAHLNQYSQYNDLIQQILIRLRDRTWYCSLRFFYPERNMVETYAALLGGELFTRLYIFFEPIGAMGQLMDLDLGLGSHGEQFFEVPMVEEENEAFNEVMEEGWAELTEAFM